MNQSKLSVMLPTAKAATSFVETVFAAVNDPQNSMFPAVPASNTANALTVNHAPPAPVHVPNVIVAEFLESAVAELICAKFTLA